MKTVKVKFDPKQTKTGFNKYKHYQFGSNTCPFCKSDFTEKDINYTWDGDANHYKKLFSCNSCRGKFGSDV